MSQDRADGGGDGHGAGVRAAAAQGGDAAVQGHALEAGDHRHLAASMAADRFSGGMSSMRARPWASSVMIGSCQPSHERALQAHVAQDHGQQAGGDLFARGDHHVVFVVGFGKARGGAAGLVGPGDQLIGLAAHGRDDHGHLLARRDFGRHQATDAADALQIGHRGAAELHHQPRHGEHREPEAVVAIDPGQRADARPSGMVRVWVILTGSNTSTALFCGTLG
jgi:hypothetical protein